MAEIRSGWKVLTRDGRSPFQGGRLLTGPLPITLPSVPLDTGQEDCAAGWNYVADIPTGWRIVGLWPTGYPARVFAVEASSDAIQRADKRRASSLTLVREATDQELQHALVEFSSNFGQFQTRMAAEQWQWLMALRRPRHNPAEVEAQLALALSTRGLSPWTLKHFDIAWDARAAWAAWTAWDTRAARAAWDARAAWAAWTAWDTRAAWDARAARAARAAWTAWAAWDAMDAKIALMVAYVRLMGWQAGEPEQYTLGIREAYANGLALARPITTNVLGWTMEEPLMRSAEAIV